MSLGGYCIKQVYTGLSRHQSLELDKCYWFGFSAEQYQTFPMLLHIDNVNVASQISEGNGTGRARSFLAGTIASPNCLNYASSWLA